MPLYFLMAIFPCTTGSHCRQVTIFLENVRFRNMRIMTLISIVSWLPMASSTSPFTYGAVEVIFGSIYFYFHLQTAPDLQDCPHSTNLPTIPESTLTLLSIEEPSMTAPRQQQWTWKLFLLMLPVPCCPRSAIVWTITRRNIWSVNVLTASTAIYCRNFINNRGDTEQSAS